MAPELDLTNSHLHTLEKVEIDPGITALDLTANRLSSIDDRILALTGLKSINFRQNLLADAATWSTCSCKAALEDLEFRDNQLIEIPDLTGFNRLRRVEFSYNEIRSMDSLQHLSAASVQELYVASNKIAQITGISQLTALTVLELGSNRLKQVENLDTLVNLQELWLGRNRIAKIQGMGCLTSLRKISIQSNRLESMLGLEQCCALEELYLSHNGIWRLEGLDTLSQLKLLDVSSNRISCVEGLDALTQLQDLWLNDNQIPELNDQLKGALSALSTLTCVYLENNPATKTQDYRATVLGWLPHLKQLDADCL